MARSLFLYEWVTGGGMAGREGRLPPSLLREGLAMVQAAAADFAAGGGGVTLLRDVGAPAIVAPGANVVPVDCRATHDEAFAQAAAEADTTLLIAPETDGALLAAAHAAAAAGARLVSPDAGFVAIAADKERTARRLEEAGVPTPAWRRVEPNERPPREVRFPAVLKPIDGAGSQDTHVLATADDHAPAYAWPRIVQEYVAGTPASVAVVGRSAGEPFALPACRQRLSDDGRLAYLGGETPLPAGLNERAADLARRAIDALPPLVGWAGVDLVLGPDPDGAEDRVIEINPRLTTSYVGLRAAARGPLLPALVSAIRAGGPPPDFDARPLAFDPDGAVYWVRSV